MLKRLTRRYMTGVEFPGNRILSQRSPSLNLAANDPLPDHIGDPLRNRFRHMTS